MTRVTTIVAHAVATAVVSVVAVAFAAAGYFGLLLWAVLAGEPIGGPFALLGMLLTAVAVVPPVVLLLLLPATALARLVRRAAGWWWWCEIPVATVLLALLVGAGYLGVSWWHGAAPTADGARTAGALAGVLLLPLGLYWWSFTAADAILRVAEAAWTRLRRACRAPEGTRQAGS